MGWSADSLWPKNDIISEYHFPINEHAELRGWSMMTFSTFVKTDVSIAKNYLKQMELEDMGRIVTAVLEFAESRAKRHIPMGGLGQANRCLSE